MERREFKKRIEKVLSVYDFTYIKKSYYYSNKDVVIVIDLQKSNYNDSYYINFGILIKALNSDIPYPKVSECDVVGRLGVRIEETTKYEVDYKVLETCSFEQGFRVEIESVIVPVMQEGVKRYFELYPMAIIAAKLKTKKYLNLE